MNVLLLFEAIPCPSYGYIIHQFAVTLIVDMTEFTIKREFFIC